MYINANTAISTSKVLLVPYEAHHVPTYHEWMKDPEIQFLTASESLTLPEEHAMQKSWRTDGDKLTFIVCLPIPQSLSLSITPPPPPQPFLQPTSPPNTASSSQAFISVKPMVYDGPGRMIGDINLFISPWDEDEDEGEEGNGEVKAGRRNENEKPLVAAEAGKGDKKREMVVGEIELMIAPVESRGCGYGRAALLSFIHYISLHFPSILSEYSSDHPNSTPTKPKCHLKWLRAKISKENEGSLKLFESVGFVRRGGENWFGEVELVFGVDGVGGMNEGGMKEVLESWEVEEWRELGYGDGIMEVEEGKGVMRVVGLS